MKKLPLVFAASLIAAAAAGAPAWAQEATPQQIQTQIANGQEQTALSELHSALQAHPDSGVAWYLTAEAQDASGNEAAARSALSKAQQLAPGLPFARPNDVAALQAHINGGGGSAPAVRHSGFSPAIIGIAGLVILFLVIRMFFRRRRFVTPGGYPAGYGQAGQYPYGPNAGPGGPGFGGGFGGGGLGSSLMGGLAAGAGLAAGERVIDDVFGNRNTGNDPFGGGNTQQDPNFNGGGVPTRDDGLNGNPGWDDGSGGTQDDGFDQNNNW